MSGTRRISIVGSVIVGSLIASGCAELDPFESSPKTSAAQPPDDIGRSDIEFLQQMIGHLTAGRRLTDQALDPTSDAGGDVRRIARHIAEEDAVRIEVMSELLEEWGVPPSRSAAVVSASDLVGPSGAAFDRAWSDAMIEHHETAIVLVDEVRRRGSGRDVDKLASGMRVDVVFEISAMGRE